MSKKLNRATEEDEVWVLLNHVKAEDWENHKNFVLNILIPAAEKVVPNEMGHTRFLYQTEPNEDGSYTSIWLMDPVIKDGNYDISKILKKAYGDEKGEEYYKLWAVNQVGFSVKQSPW